MTDRSALMGTGFETKAEGGASIPVLKARGRFTSMGVNAKQSRDVDPNTGKPKEYSQVAHTLVDLEVREVKEGTEFPFDSLEFFISASSKEGSAYHAWIASIKAALPNIDWEETVDTGVVDEAGDPVTEMVWASYAKIYDELLDGNFVEIDRTQTVPMPRKINDAWVEKDIPVWKLISVEGGAGGAAPVAAGTALETAVALVGTVGDIEAFRNGVTGSSVIAGDEALLLELVSATDLWLADQVAAGTLTANGDWFSVA